MRSIRERVGQETQVWSRDALAGGVSALDGRDFVVDAVLFAEASGPPSASKSIGCRLPRQRQAIRRHPPRQTLPQHSPKGTATRISGAAQPPVNIAAKADTEERTIVVENDLYRVEFSNRGAVVKSWQLKKYLDDSKPQRVSGRRASGSRSADRRMAVCAGAGRRTTPIGSEWRSVPDFFARQHTCRLRPTQNFPGATATWR